MAVAPSCRSLAIIMKKLIILIPCQLALFSYAVLGANQYYGTFNGTWAPGYAVLTVGTNHVGYPSIAAANSNSVDGRNDVIDAYGSLVESAPIHQKVGQTINLNGAVITNTIDLNVFGPLIQPGDNSRLNGPGDIYPVSSNITGFCACYGFSSQVGNASATNFYASRVKMHGDTDVVYLYHTNFFSGTVEFNFIDGMAADSWDILVIESPPAFTTTNGYNMLIQGNTFHNGPNLSSQGGATLNGIRVGMGTCVFKNNIHIVEGTTLPVHAVLDNAVGTFFSNNRWENETFIVLGTNSAGVTFSELANTTTNKLINCNFYGNGHGQAMSFNHDTNTVLINVNCFGYDTNLGLLNQANVGTVYFSGGNVSPATGTGAARLVPVIQDPASYNLLSYSNTWNFATFTNGMQPGAFKTGNSNGIAFPTVWCSNTASGSAFYWVTNGVKGPPATQ